MTELICYSGSIVDKNHKERCKLMYIEDLFDGDVKNKAPQALRRKISQESMTDIETCISCFYGAPAGTKVAFRNYKHFRKTLDDTGINLKQYTK